MVIYTSLTLNKRTPLPYTSPRPKLTVLYIVGILSLSTYAIYTYTRSIVCFIIYSQGPWGCSGVSLTHTHIKIHTHTHYSAYTRLYPFDPACGGHASPLLWRWQDRFFLLSVPEKFVSCSFSVLHTDVRPPSTVVHIIIYLLRRRHSRRRMPSVRGR
jgi:hypothetical protein